MASLLFALKEMRTLFQHYPAGVKILLLVLQLFICITSWFLTGLIIFILATTKKLRTPSNLVTSSLLGSGLILSAGVLPMTIIELLVKDKERNELYQAIRSYLTIVYLGLTITSIIIIAIIRAYQLRSMRTPQNQISKKLLVTILIVSFCIIMVYPALLAYIGSVFRLKGLGTALLISIVLALVILSIAYYSIWNEIKKSKQRLRSTSNQSTAGSYHQKAAQTIQRVMIAFVATHALLIIRGILIIYSGYHSHFEENNLDVLNDIDVASLMIASLDVIINPVIYFYMQGDIRKELFRIKLIQMVLRERNNNESYTPSTMIGENQTTSTDSSNNNESYTPSKMIGEKQTRL